MKGSTSSTPSNCSLNDGSATVVAIGEQAYMHAWSPNGGTNAIATGLLRSYAVTITDANGCTGAASVVVSSVGIDLGNGGSPVVSGGECCNTTGIVFSIPAVP
ncbi:MAG: hypothetical protein IPP38_17810 [Bacteroidetes bacterium]|nr:hypothetical protein [Bacteroidota bacterium]